MTLLPLAQILGFIVLVALCIGALCALICSLTLFVDTVAYCYDWLMDIMNEGGTQ